MPFDRQHDRRILERELLRPVYLRQLAWLRHQTPGVLHGTTWPAAAARVGTPVPDSVLRPILLAAQREGFETWIPIVLLLFWSSLESILRMKRHWGDSAEDLWSDVVASFLSAIARLDLDQRGERLAQRLFGDAVHGTYLTCSRRWATSRAEELGATEGDCLLLDLPEPEQDRQAAQEALEWRCDREFRRRFYLKLLRRRVISWQDYVLLCGTRICGWTVAATARRVGLRPEAAKKRLQRAEDRIRSIDPLREEMLSPSGRGRGPWRIEALAGRKS